MNIIYILIFVAGIQKGGAGFSQEFSTIQDCKEAAQKIYDEIRPRLDTEIMMLQCVPKNKYAVSQLVQEQQK